MLFCLAQEPGLRLRLLNPIKGDGIASKLHWQTGVLPSFKHAAMKLSTKEPPRSVIPDPDNFDLHGCFRKWWSPQITHFNRVKPSILGYHHLKKHPHARKRCGPKFVTHFTLLSAMVFLTSPAGSVMELQAVILTFFVRRGNKLNDNLKTTAQGANNILIYLCIYIYINITGPKQVVLLTTATESAGNLTTFQSWLSQLRKTTPRLFRFTYCWWRRSSSSSSSEHLIGWIQCNVSILQ